MKRTATLDPARVYRFDLVRAIDPACHCAVCASSVAVRPGYVLWILNNPSTADESNDDPTVRRCWGFTSRWGYGCMVFVNTNPYRATRPEEACNPTAQALEFNDHYLKLHFAKAEKIIVAWGTKAFPWTVGRVKTLLRQYAHSQPYAMKVTRNGHPQHPLYLHNNTEPKLWTP